MAKIDFQKKMSAGSQLEQSDVCVCVFVSVMGCVFLF